jgi:hypothetical protein
VRHAQFVDVGEAIRLTTGTTVNVRNALVVRASTGVPLDTDGDGIPDWMEDVNGDGSKTGDPSSWTQYTSTHGITNGGLSLFSPLK